MIVSSAAGCLLLKGGSRCGLFLGARAVCRARTTAGAPLCRRGLPPSQGTPRRLCPHALHGPPPGAQSTCCPSPPPHCLGPSTPHPSQFLAGPQLLRQVPGGGGGGGVGGGGPQVPPQGRGSDPGFRKAGSLCKPTLPKPKQQRKAGAPLLPTGSRCSTLQGTALVR